jgi:hypothetical protein
MHEALASIPSTARKKTKDLAVASYQESGRMGGLTIIPKRNNEAKKYSQVHRK